MQTPSDILGSVAESLMADAALARNQMPAPTNPIEILLGQIELNLKIALDEIEALKSRVDLLERD